MLRKYAPQGNATVFPLQSITYAILAIASVIWMAPRGTHPRPLHDAIESASRTVRVYGDDIVVPTYALPALSSLLELCQLKINGAKSHFSGNFAESCGMDAFRGTDVTPVYLRYIGDVVTPESILSHVDVSNSFHKDGLLRTASVVLNWVPDFHRRWIPVTRDPGLPISLHCFNPGILARKHRWNKFLHVSEVLALVPVVRKKTGQREGWENLLQYYTEEPDQDTNWSSGWLKDSRLRLGREWVPSP
jgi:hypothetical protein